MISLAFSLSKGRESEKRNDCASVLIQRHFSENQSPWKPQKLFGKWVGVLFSSTSIWMWIPAPEMARFQIWVGSRSPSNSLPVSQNFSKRLLSDSHACNEVPPPIKKTFWMGHAEVMELYYKVRICFCIWISKETTTGHRSWHSFANFRRFGRKYSIYQIATQSLINSSACGSKWDGLFPYFLSNWGRCTTSLNCIKNRKLGAIFLRPWLSFSLIKITVQFKRMPKMNGVFFQSQMSLTSFVNSLSPLFFHVVGWREFYFLPQ